MSAADRLLERLDGVKESGAGRWLARCPSHDDRSPSLSIRETGDGTVLVHCFAGCDSADILTAVGLELQDLFPDGARVHHIPSRSGRLPAADALAAIDHEIVVAQLIIANVAARRSIDDPTWGRLQRAAQTIGRARDRTCPARAGRPS